jgi:hypothetical protein
VSGCAQKFLLFFIFLHIAMRNAHLRGEIH